MSITHRVKRLLGASLAGAMVLALMPAGIAAAQTINTDDVAACEGSAGLVGFNDNLGFFESEIECMAAFGITVGDTEGNFNTSASTTRQQMALFIARFVAQAQTGTTDIPPSTGDAFDDISDISPQEARDAINWLADLGITTGVTADTFDPSGNVTRQQMASFFARAHTHLNADLPDPSDPSAFTDTDDIADVHTNNVLTLHAAGVVEGFADGSYGPNALVTRGQMSAFVVRSIGVLEAQGLWNGAFVVGPPLAENTGQVVAFNTQVDTDGAGNEYLIADFDIQAADFTPVPTADVGVYVFVSETDVIVTVTYESGDSFVLDGATVSRAVFNANVRAGDEVEFAEGEDSNTHTLTTDTVVEGQVGNVAINTDVFVFLNPVTGTIVGGFDSEVDSSAVRTLAAEFANGAALTNYDTTRSLFSVDGSSVGLADFEENISEGDDIRVSGTTDVLFALTNAEISGTVTGFVDRVTTLPPGADATFQIESAVTPFGSDFRKAQKVDFVVDGSSVVSINAVDADNDKAAFFVDGDRVTLVAFVDAMNDGDHVSYERSGDFETFTLVNRAPAAIEGIVVDSTGTGGVAFSTAGSGTANFAVYASGSVTVVDFDNPTVSINGVTSTITEFGDVVRAGGEVVYQAGDADTGTSETLTYTTANVSGSVGTVNTGGTAYDVVADDGATVLIAVNYTTGTNTYQVDGSAASQAGFETALATSEDDEASVITVVADAVETDYNDGAGEYQHQLATS